MIIQWREIIQLMPSARRWHLCLTLALMILATVAEMVTIGAVIPFLAFASNAGSSLPHSDATGLFALFPAYTLTGVTIFLCVAALIAGIIRLLLVWTIQRLIELFGHDLSHKIFVGMLRETYADHLLRSSSHYSSVVTMVQDVVFGFIQPLMQATTSIFMAIAIAILLIVISPAGALVGLSLLLVVYVVISRFTSRKLSSNSKIIAQNAVKRTKIVQESFGSFRDIVLDRSYDAVVDKFDFADVSYRRAKSMNNIISASPRFLVESIGIITIALITLSLVNFGDDFQSTIPILGAIALGAQRMLPMVQSAWSGFALASGNRQLFNEVREFATAPLPTGSERLPRASFKENIVFDEVTFAYERGEFILEDISFEICKGEHLGISGATGSGKSTLVDLLLGLIEPARGEIRIDERILRADWRSAWHGCVAHVPQSIFLVDDSIATNITLGSDADLVDQEKMQTVLKAAQLLSFVNSQDEGLDTRIGEGGIRISGGQRQRIGIARALYRSPDLLILDEATNALDERTETDLLQAIAKLSSKMTVVSVSHRQSTLMHCDRVLKMDQFLGTARKQMESEQPNE